MFDNINNIILNLRYNLILDIDSLKIYRYLQETVQYIVLPSLRENAALNGRACPPLRENQVQERMPPAG